MTPRSDDSDPPADDDLVPVSVRLGEVVPPEDPEDWTKPLTWVAAAGMLLGPLVAVTWFLVAPPARGNAQPATWLLAASVAGGAVLTGATQQGALRAWSATVAAALFSALAVIVVGAALAGERQVGQASPPLAHAFGAALAGLAGAVAGSPLAARMAGIASRRARLLVPGAVAFGVVLLAVALAFGLT
jgi:hypothetical protein